LSEARGYGLFKEVPRHRAMLSDNFSAVRHGKFRLLAESLACVSNEPMNPRVEHIKDDLAIVLQMRVDEVQ
jgi:hypothetical protein